MKNFISQLIKVIFVLIAVSCASSKNFTSTYPMNEFYFDQNNFALIRFINGNNIEIQTRYNEWMSNNPYKSYEFYESEILRLSKSEFDTTDTKKYRNLTQKPKILNRPSPQYPNDTKMSGDFLKIVVQAVVDTLGYVEYAQLYNLYRQKNIQENSISDCEPAWTCTNLYNTDIPFIKAAIYAALKTTFLPAKYDGVKRKVKVKIPYHFQPKK